MSDYSSCLLQGYGVLPGQPSRVKAPLVSSHFAILEWNPPKILPDTVTSYHVSIRKLGSGDDYEVIEKDHPPLIMEGLDSATYYEAYVVAVNAHGKGGPSPRIVFRTKHDVSWFWMLTGKFTETLFDVPNVFFLSFSGRWFLNNKCLPWTVKLFINKFKFKLSVGCSESDTMVEVVHQSISRCGQRSEFLKKSCLFTERCF